MEGNKGRGLAMSEWVVGTYSRVECPFSFPSTQSGSEYHERKGPEALGKAGSQKGKRRDGWKLVDGMEGEGPGWG